MRILRTLLSALLVSAAAGAADAGVVSALSGQASAITPEGIAAIDVGTQLQPGSRLMVSQGSTVTIAFSPNCEITIGQGETYRIPEDPRCEGGATSSGSAYMDNLEIVAGVLAGAGLIAGIVIAASQSGGGDDALPVSP